jgi:fatty acid desaturase
MNKDVGKIGFFHWFWNVNLKTREDRLGFIAAITAILFAISAVTALVLSSMKPIWVFLVVLVICLGIFISYLIYGYIRAQYNSYRAWRERELNRTAEILRRNF